MQTIQWYHQLIADSQMPAFTILRLDSYNQEYEGFDFCFEHDLNVQYRSRLAKKTSKKAGYFLAIWEKNSENKNVPFDIEKFPEYLVVNIMDGDQKGRFIFPKSILYSQGILSSPTEKGKMAFRIYAPWNKNLNSNASKVAKWQLPFFVGGF